MTWNSGKDCYIGLFMEQGSKRIDDIKMSTQYKVDK